jgi:hypothetical protein
VHRPHSADDPDAEWPNNILMGMYRTQLEEWLRLGKARRAPDLEAAMRAAADACDAALESGRLTEEQLRVVVAAVNDPRKLLWELAAGYLKRLGERWPEAAAAVLGLSRSPKAQPRFNALLALGHKTPQPVMEAVLRSGLADKNARSRGKAAQQLQRFEQRTLVADLQAAIAAESRPEVRREMEFHLALLCDGYVLQPWADGSCDLTVRTRDGWASRRVPSEERAAKDIGTIVQEFRASISWMIRPADKEW